MKQQYENASNEIELILSREKKCEEQLRRAQRNNKDTLEEFGEIKKKLIDLDETKKRLVKCFSLKHTRDIDIVYLFI